MRKFLLLTLFLFQAFNFNVWSQELECVETEKQILALYSGTGSPDDIDRKSVVYCHLLDEFQQAISELSISNNDEDDFEEDQISL